MKKIPFYCFSNIFLEFDEWYSKFEEEINIELAETGKDRELDFDPEKEFVNRYNIYLEHNLY